VRGHGPSPEQPRGVVLLTKQLLRSIFGVFLSAQEWGLRSLGHSQQCPLRALSLNGTLRGLVYGTKRDADPTPL
jgi:hypothetical protein